jgi:hypothetical protein
MSWIGPIELAVLTIIPLLAIAIVVIVVRGITRK